MENAIKKAIEGGWKEGEKWQFVTANRYWVTWLDGNGTEVAININVYLLDSKFWQCLIPKETKVTLDLKKMTITQVGRVPLQRPKQKVSYIRKTPNKWKTVWHRFIDHLAEGKDAEEFFSNLLNKE